MDIQKLTNTPPVDTVNIRYASKFAKRETEHVSCGFDFKDSMGHKNFVQEIVEFHVEVLSALETEGFQNVNHASAQLIEMYLEIHQMNARSIHDTTDDNIRLIVNYGLNWVHNGVINDPTSVNHQQTKMFPVLVLNLASVYVDGPQDKNHIETNSVIDIPLQRNIFIRAGCEYHDEPDDLGDGNVD